jgi:DNA-binding response OmpR family regulator
MILDEKIMILDVFIDILNRMSEPLPVPDGLTPIERVIFDKLAVMPGEWVSAAQLIEVCEENRNRGTSFNVTSLWAHINRLRKKLRGCEIVSAIKVGYMIRRKL